VVTIAAFAAVLGLVSLFSLRASVLVAPRGRPEHRDVGARRAPARDRGDVVPTRRHHRQPPTRSSPSPARSTASARSGCFALAYTIVVYLITLVILPRLWTGAARNGCVTTADRVRARPSSPGWR
jgi:hypothetical protein